MKLFVSGEGPDELGEWARHPAYRPRAEEPAAHGGILHALVRRLRTEHVVVDAWRWRDVRKFRAGKHDAAEMQTVLGLALRAEELGCNALVFVRDRDRDAEREADVERGLEAARRFDVQLVGGTANEEIEAWLLAMKGERRSELHADAKAVLRVRHEIADRTAKMEVVETANLEAIPDDCESLRRWLARAKALSE